MNFVKMIHSATVIALGFALPLTLSSKATAQADARVPAPSQTGNGP